MGQMRDEKKLAVGSCQGADESGLDGFDHQFQRIYRQGIGKCPQQS